MSCVVNCSVNSSIGVASRISQLSGRSCPNSSRSSPHAIPIQPDFLPDATGLEKSVETLSPRHFTHKNHALLGSPAGLRVSRS